MITAISVRLLARVPAVQTWLAQRITGWLGGELNTKISVGFVDIKLFSSVELKDFFIADLHGDTLLYAPSLEVRISSISLKDHKLVIRKAILDHARIAVVHEKDPRQYNLDFIIKYFSSSTKDTTTTSKPWKLKIENIELTENTFSYRDLKYSDTTRCIDWEDLYLTHLNVNLKDLEPDGDTLNFKAERIAFLEKSGFRVKEFQSDVKLQPGKMQFSHLHIETPYSELQSSLEFNYNSIVDFEKFITDVHWQGEFSESVIAADDLAYFSSELFGVNRKVAFHGKVKGTVEHFKARDLEIRYSPQTYFRGNVNMSGLPDFADTYMEIGVDELSLRRTDLLTIPSYPFDSVSTISIPENIGALGVVKFKGKFNGFYNDFVAYGNTQTALGYISSDINLKIRDEDRKTSYSGNLKLFDFDMGKFWGVNPDVGRVSLNAKIAGKGFELNNLDANLEGQVSRLEVRQYDYTNLKVTGNIRKKLFNGALTVTDPNLSFDFDGSIDFNARLPVYNFNAIVHEAKIAKLHLADRDTSASLSAELTMNMSGSNVDNMQGTLMAEDVHYSELSKTVTAGKLFIESKLGDQRSLTLESDFADAYMRGHYSLSDLGNSVRWVIASYFPSIGGKVRWPSDQQIAFRFETGETEKLTDIFAPQVHISAGTVAEGSLNTDRQDIRLQISSKSFIYDNIILGGINLNGNGGNGVLTFSSAAQTFQLNDSLKLYNVKLNGSSTADSLNMRVSMNGRDCVSNQADVLIAGAFFPDKVTVINIKPNHLKLNGKAWTLADSNSVRFDTSGITLSDIHFSDGVQEVKANGRIGNDTASHLQLAFKDFISSQLNDFLYQYDVNIGGTVNGTAVLSELTGHPYLETDLRVDSLSWYGDTLGNAEAIAKWDSDAGVVDINGTVTRGGYKNILVKGEYIIGKKEDRIDLDITVQKTNINTFSHYVKGLFSDLGGIASANLKLSGPSKNPLLTGKAYLQKASLTVDYLKAAYTFSAEIDLDADAIICKDVTINDINGNRATLNASIYHNHLHDFYFDIDIKARNMQVLNTGPADNDLFYGRAFATGNVSIAGGIDNMEMNIGLKTEKGTAISIPLSNPDEISRSSFITFIKKDTTGFTQDTLKGPDFSGLTLNMDFEATPDATVYLIFDDKIGDVIEGTGSGNLSMTVSPTEDLRMFGNYEIEQGRYLFTMQNVINKPFVINRGGYIRWNGDPYDADVKIDATYKIKTGLYDLFQDSSFKKLVPVELQLHLTDKLFNPSIAFDINVQNVDPTIDNQVRRLINTEEEKYRQAVALLVMRRFTSPSEVSNRTPVSSSGLVGANAYELLSNQLSNWVNTISNQVNFGVNYRPADALTSEELEVVLSTSILNDRVTLDGNVGYANTTGTNNQSTSNIVGDFNVEVKARKDGRVRLKAFNRSNNNSLINNLNSQYTQGVGIFYREEFNDFSELWKRYRDLFRKTSNTTPVQQDPL